MQRPCQGVASPGWPSAARLKLLDHGVWEGAVTPFHQARAEQRINAFLRTLWHEVTIERLRHPAE
jgi:hypothetical protein